MFLGVMRTFVVRLFLVTALVLTWSGVQAAPVVEWGGNPGTSYYIRIITSSTASIAVALTEGTSGSVGVFRVEDTALVSGGLTTPGRYTYKVFEGGTPSTTANDVHVATGELNYWNGSTLVDATSRSVWSAARTGHTTVGTFGEGVTSVVGSVGSVVSAVAVTGTVELDVPAQESVAQAARIEMDNNSTDLNSILDDTGTSGVVLANNAITSAKIATDAITATGIAANAITSSEIDLSSEAVASVTGAVGSVTGNIGGNVVGSVGSVSGSVASVTGSVGSVVGNVGGNVVGSVASVTGNVGGNVTGSVGSIGAGGISSSSFGAGAINAAAVASDAIGAAELATDAVTEVQSGLATSAAVANVQTAVNTTNNYVDTEIGDIKTKTDFLPSITPGSAGGLFVAGSNAATTVNFTGSLSGSVGSVTGNVGGNVTGSVGSVGLNGITASSLATDSRAAIASQVRTELTTELARLDVATSTRASGTQVDDLPTNAELNSALGNINVSIDPADKQDIIDSVVTGSNEGRRISPTYIDSAKVWRFEAVDQIEAPNKVYEAVGFDGLLGMRFVKAMPSNTSIDQVISIVATKKDGSPVTTELIIGDSTITADLKEVHFVLAIGTKGEYFLTVTIQTADSQQVTRKGRLIVQ